MKSKELIASVIEELSNLDLESRVACNQLDRIAANIYKASTLLDGEQYAATVAAYAAKENN